MEIFTIKTILTTSLRITQGAHPVFVPVWIFCLILLIIPLGLIVYIAILMCLNTNQKSYLCIVTLPRILQIEEKEQFTEMAGIFSSLHNLIQSNIDKLFIEVIKTNTYITIQIGSNNRLVLQRAIHVLRAIKNIQVEVSKKDFFVGERLFARTLSSTKAYFPIAKNPHFFEHLLTYLSSLKVEDQAGVQIILRGVNKQEELITAQHNLEHNVFKRKRGFTPRERSLYEFFTEKQRSHLYKVKINVISNKKDLLAGLTSLFHSLSQGENMFLSRGEKEKNIQKRYIAPETFLSNVSEVRKYEGSYVTSEELAYLFHPVSIQTGIYAPNQQNTIDTIPEFRGRSEQSLLIGMTEDNKNLFLPLTNLAKHMYIIGKTGRGKSTLLTTLLQEIAQKEASSMFVFDPHGDLIIDTIYSIGRSNRLVYLQTKDQERLFTINPLFCFRKSRTQKAVIKDAILDILQTETEEITGNNMSGATTYNRMDQMLAIAIEFPDAYYHYLTTIKHLDEKQAQYIVNRRQLTLNDLPFLLEKKMGYFFVLQTIFHGYSSSISQYVLRLMEDHMRQVAVVEAVQVRFNQLLHASIKLIVEGNSFSLEQALESNNIFLFPLSESVYGTRGARGLMQILFSLLWIYKREQTRERKDTLIVIDEFQKAQIQAIPEIIAEGRKYKLSLIISNQQLGQLRKDVKDAILGNVGTLVSFTVSADDSGAKTLAPFFGKDVSESDLVQLPAYQGYIRTEGAGKKSTITFSFTTTKHENKTDVNIPSLINDSLERYGEDRNTLEQRILAKQTDAISYFFEGIG